MFDFYQVTHIRATFIPYKYEYPGNTGTITYAKPVFSILDPENGLPTTVSNFYGYNTCKVTRPYEPHHRSMERFINLGIQKQDKIVLATNGSWNSRE
jgi:hypothetical protein